MLLIWHHRQLNKEQKDENIIDMDSMKSAFSEAILRRKHKPTSSKAEEDQNKKQDLAPEVKDAPSAKLEIEIGMKPMMHGVPPEMGDGQMNDMSDEPDNMHSFVSPQEAEMLNKNEKPKSLLQRAQKAFISKKG